jgi:hypothetical protein
LARGVDTAFVAWFAGVGAGGTREDTGCEDQLGGWFRVDGEGRKDLGDSVSLGSAGALGRFSEGSGAALVIVCVRVGGAGRIRGEVGLRRNCELGSRRYESWSYGPRERNP